MMTGDDICRKAKRWPVVSSVLSGKEACSHACRGHTSQSALRGTAFHWGGPEAPGKWPRGPGAGRTAGDMRADGVRSETGPRCGQQLTPHWQGDHGGRGSLGGPLAAGGSPKSLAQAMTGEGEVQRAPGLWPPSPVACPLCPRRPLGGSLSQPPITSLLKSKHCLRSCATGSWCRRARSRPRAADRCGDPPAELEPGAQRGSRPRCPRPAAWDARGPPSGPFTPSAPWEGACRPPCVRVTW